MTPHTQSNTDPGNCWQTAMACLLDVPAESLPDQVTIEAVGGSYNNALLAYLAAHHDATFARVPTWQLFALRPIGFHLMIGPTVRTTPDRPINHVVVGRDGAQTWDPHPSRAGLARAEHIEIVVPLPEERRESYARMRLLCLCPACGVRLTINGRDRVVPAGSLTYEEILRLAGERDGASVTYSAKLDGDGHRSGILSAGRSIVPAEGMKITAVQTGGA